MSHKLDSSEKTTTYCFPGRKCQQRLYVLPTEGFLNAKKSFVTCPTPPETCELPIPDVQNPLLDVEEIPSLKLTVRN